MSEVLGSIFKYALMLLALAAVVGLGMVAINSNKNANAVAQASQLVFNIQSSYPSGAFTTLSKAVVMAGDKGTRMAPDAMISGNSLVNPFGGPVDVYVNASNAANFDFSSAQVSSSGCQKLATSMTSALGLTINGTAQTLPVDAGTAALACQNGSNTMVMTFGH